MLILVRVAVMVCACVTECLWRTEDDHTTLVGRTRVLLRTLLSPPPTLKKEHGDHRCALVQGSKPSLHAYMAVRASLTERPNTCSSSLCVSLLGLLKARELHSQLLRFPSSLRLLTLERLNDANNVGNMNKIPQRPTNTRKALKQERKMGHILTCLGNIPPHSEIGLWPWPTAATSPHGTITFLQVPLIQ